MHRSEAVIAVKDYINILLRSGMTTHWPWGSEDGTIMSGAIWLLPHRRQASALTASSDGMESCWFVTNLPQHLCPLPIHQVPPGRQEP